MDGYIKQKIKIKTNIIIEHQSLQECERYSNIFVLHQTPLGKMDKIGEHCAFLREGITGACPVLAVVT